jgi:predicted DCC family thiol-disulfide oxidoreductase YuxK
MLIFDGDCGFCTWAAEWTRRRLRPEGVVEPWQWVVDLEAYGLTRGDVSTAVYWIDPHGTVHRGHKAVAASLRAMGGGWGLLGITLSVPPIRWVAAVAYELIARNRHRLPGSTPACRLPKKPRAT